MRLFHHHHLSRKVFIIFSSLNIAGGARGHRDGQMKLRLEQGATVTSASRCWENKTGIILATVSLCHSPFITRLSFDKLTSSDSRPIWQIYMLILKQLFQILQH